MTISTLTDLQTIDSELLAQYILWKVGKASHLKVQKLLYYIQGYHLAYFDEPVIEDDFEAWVHGPVSRRLFDRLKDKSLLHWEVDYVQNPTEERPIEEIIREKLTADQIELIDEVLAMLWEYQGIVLEQMTHAEKPWQDARRGFDPGEKCENIIDREKIKEFFRPRVVHG